MALHPAWAKNIVRRVLWAAIERDLTKKERKEIKDFFGNTCAFCGKQLTIKPHMDHLTGIDKGGVNHLSNRVPACSDCNEKEKQDLDWKYFLKQKCQGKNQFKTREKKILDWIKKHETSKPQISTSQREEWRAQINKVAEIIDQAWEILKKTKGN